MKLCVSNIAWDTNQDEAAAEILAKHGIDSVEIAPTKYWPAPCQPNSAEVDRCKQFWSERGVPIRAMQALLFGMPHLSIFQPNVLDQTRDYLILILKMGAQMGAKRFVFGSPKNRDRGERSTEEANQLAIEFFRPLAQIANDLGIVLCLEPNPTAYQCNFMTNTTEALAVVSAVDHPGLALHLDSGIMFLNGESAASAIALAGEYLKHFHISHPQLASVEVGGPIDHAEIARELRASKYSGMVSVEMRGAENPADNLGRLNVACELLNKYYRQ